MAAESSDTVSNNITASAMTTMTSSDSGDDSLYDSAAITEAEKKKWKECLGLTLPENPGDEETNKVGDRSATEYYAERKETAKKLHEYVWSKGNASDLKASVVKEFLEQLVFPHNANITALVSSVETQVSVLVNEAAVVEKASVVDEASVVNKASVVNEASVELPPPIEETSDALTTEENLDFLGELEEEAQSKIREVLKALKKQSARKEAEMARKEAEIARKEAEMARMEAEMAREEAEMALKELDVEMASKKTHLDLMVQQIAHQAWTTHWSTVQIDSHLARLSILSQSENSLQTQETEAIRQQSKNEKMLQDRANAQYGGEELPWEICTIEKKLFKAAEPFPCNSQFHPNKLVELWNTFDALTQEQFLAIEQIYNDFISTSTILDRPKDPQERNNKRQKTDSHVGTAPYAAITVSLAEYKRKVEESTNLLRKRFRMAIERSDRTNKLKKAAVQGDGGKSELMAQCTFFPGPRYQETVGAQPFFGCLVEAVGLLAETIYAQKRSTLQAAQPKPTLSSDGRSVDDKTLCTTNKLDHYKEDGMQKETPESSFGKEGAVQGREWSAQAAQSVTKVLPSGSSGPSGKEPLGGLSNSAFKNKIDGMSSTTGSPPNSALGKESAVQGENNKFRFGDFSFTKSGRNFWLFRPDTTPIIIEIKAFYQGDKNWKELVADAVQQVLKHTSRHLMVSLNFAGGAGVKSHASGVIASLAYLQVYRLELSLPGTHDMCLKLVKSELFRLMKPAIFSKWAEACSREGENSKSKFADEDFFRSPEERDLPLGILLIYQLMWSSKSELFGQTHDGGLHLLATGAFGNVFLNKNSDQVVKMSRRGGSAYLRAEATAYKAVGQIMGRTRLCDFLAVGKFKTVHVPVGTISVQMPALVLSPVGRPLMSLGDISGQSELLCRLVLNVAQALRHMHEQQVAHNDVSLMNVVVVTRDGVEFAVLVDLSLACPFDFEIPFFYGNPTFVHRDVHSDMAREPRPFHDMAALGFLAAVLCSGSISPWSLSKPWKGANKEVFVERSKKAKHAIGGAVSDKQIKELFTGWVELDQKSVIRKACTCSKGPRWCSGKKCECKAMKLRCLESCKCMKDGHSCSMLSTLQKFASVADVSIAYDVKQSCAGRS